MAKDTYKDRVVRGVVQAIWEAGQSPNGAIELDIPDAVDAMATAMAQFIFASCAMVGQEDPQQAETQIEALSQRVQVRLKELAKVVANGTVILAPRKAPALRIVT